MRRISNVVAWLAVLVAGGWFAVWAYPRAFPLAPENWRIARGEAERLALDALRDLGELPAASFVVARLDGDATGELRLLDELAAGADRERVRASDLAREVLVWEIAVYPAGARPGEWSHRARIALDGTVLALRRGFKSDAPGPAVDEAEARARALAYLAEQGIDVTRFAPPQTRRQELTGRTDLTFRFPSAERLLGDRVSHGIEVGFAGDQLAGYWTFREDPDWRALAARTQGITLFGNFAFLAAFVLLPVLGVPFLRRYHLGEIGVRRGLEIGGLVFVLAVLLVVAMAAAETEGPSWGSLSRRQMAWIWPAQFLALFFLPLALLAFFGWSTGESFCRERWGHKLAAFDALLQGDWHNRTVAASALRGTALGTLLTGAVLVVTSFAPDIGARALWSIHLGPFWHQTAWPGVALVAFSIVFGLYAEMVGRLFLVPALVGRLGRIGGALAAALLGLLLFSMPVIALPLKVSIPLGVATTLVSVAAFLRWDLLTSTMTTLGPLLLMGALPLAATESRSLQLQGGIAILAYLLPLGLSLRFVNTGEEFVYRYEDVPPHVRRIAERERHRVELETARNIQSSILPELPPSLAGVELAHTYVPAQEVGGDFYDVLALDDGRLAVAVGDVAGHGVSSGLVMSMAKSALAVQVTFDPEVEAVFATLNRMVYQSARKRLLATLCYAVIDPRRREMRYASAGHLFPYRISAQGDVEALESVSYPLGVRPTLQIEPRVARLEPGDVVFLCSDGLVEARREGTEISFGFDRLERILARLGGRPPGALRDEILAELTAFTGDSPREDDLTLLVLRIP